MNASGNQDNAGRRPRRPFDVDDALFDEVHRLICAQAEDRLTPADALRLESLVLTDPIARRLYATLVRDTAYLRWYAEAPAAGADVAPPSFLGDLDLEAAAEELAPPAVVGRIAPRADQALVGASFFDTDDDEEELAVAPNYVRAPEPEPRWRRWMPYAAAAAVLLVVGLVMTVVMMRGGEPAKPIAATQPAPEPLPPVVFAKLADAVDATWEVPSAPKVGQDLGIGPWVLRRGNARVVFASGADVVVRAPARFQLLSADAMLLMEGVVSAVAGNKKSEGFVIHTPTATVRDIGTEFGVRVTPAGVTEAHVLVGIVDLKPGAGGDPVRLSKEMAAAVKEDGLKVERIPFMPARFGRDMRTVDLVDIVAGGDGTEGRRDAGIDPLSGALVNGPPTNPSFTGDNGQFHRCDRQRLIAGVFIPPATGTPAVVDPDGHTVNDLRVSESKSWYWLWAGGKVALPEDRMVFYPTTLRGVDYAAGGRGLIFMQPNKGITFDLAEIRRVHPGKTFGRFRAVCGNTVQGLSEQVRVASPEVDVRVLIDGLPAHKQNGIHRADAPFDIDIAIPVTAKFLTLLVTDAGDGYQGDWIIFGDARLE